MKKHTAEFKQTPPEDILAVSELMDSHIKLNNHQLKTGGCLVNS